MAKKIRKVMPVIPVLPTRKRVAAYARVSSGKDAMLHSLSAQVSYYSHHIQHNPEWVYFGVYVDEALTGTKATRKDFQRMLADCRSGKIDMIITKSISRFARNTVTLLETVRELKALGVDVYFEEQNIHTMSGDGELMLTILASYAQEESLSASENCKWRIRNNFKQGLPTWFQIYGYRMVNGQLQIVPEEAAVVKMIFQDYLSGMGRELICKKLLELGIPPLGGGVWNPVTISYMLKNECYAGDLRLQKYFSNNHLEKKKIKNRGELPQYVVQGAHEPIIDRNTFVSVQVVVAVRRARFHPDVKAQARYPFSGLIVCGQCGKIYRRKTASIGTPYSKPVWICTTFNSLGKKYCQSKQIPEELLMKITAGVLGLSAFDPAIVMAQVDHIVVSGHRELRYYFTSGLMQQVEWDYESRSDSWSNDMRAIAAEKTRARYLV